MMHWYVVVLLAIKAAEGNVAQRGLPVDFSTSYKSAELLQKFPDHSLQLLIEILSGSLDSGYTLNFKALQDQKCFTWDEVSTFNGVDGVPLCIVFDDSVYNVTDFVQYHPGGASYLTQFGGRDAGAAMRASTMPAYAFDAMKRFRVGYLVPHWSSC